MASARPAATVWKGLLAVVAGAVAFEGTVRLDDWARFGTPMASGAASLGDLVIRDSLGTHARPGAAFRQFVINGQGFRGPELPTRPDGALVLAVSGASETFGLYERAGGEWPRQLEDSLRTRCAVPVRVLNAGFAGMALPTVMQDVQRRLAPLRPDVGVYYPTPAQYLEAERPVATAPVATPTPAPPPWQLRSVPRSRDALKRAVPEPLLDLVRQVDTRRQRRALAEAQGDAQVDTLPRDRLAAYEEDLRRLVGVYRQGGMTPVLVVHQHRFADTLTPEARRTLRAWERFYPRYTGRVLLAFDAAAGARTREVARDSQLVVVDPQAPLRRLGAQAFADFSHFTDAGAAIVGGVVAAGVADHPASGVACRTPPRGAPLLREAGSRRP
jgi:hypothetical protein